MFRETHRLASIVLFVVGAYSSFAQLPPPEERIPKSVDEAVLLLKAELTPSERDYLLRTPRNHAVADLHFPYGTGVRNRFKMWDGGNPELMSSCGVRQPEDCSGIIFDRLWESLRADSDPVVVRQLDCQFKLTEEIDINYRGFDNLTIGKMLQRVQEQIDQQMVSMAKSGSQPCQTLLQLKLTGDPNLSCFVRAEFAKEKSSHVSLDMFWGWIGWRNGFDVLHDPPNIRIHFKNKCAWPQRPNF